MDDIAMVHASVLLTSVQMGQADMMTIASGTPGIILMERAGGHVARVASEMCPPQGRIAIVCGPGNNGGDGFVAARHLHQAGHTVDVLLLKDPAGLKGDAAIAYEQMGLPAQVFEPAGLEEKLSGCNLIIDALFGAGLDRSLEGNAAAFADCINKSGLPVLSVDLASGVNGSTGEVGGTAVQAARSVTFFRCKPGHYLLPGRDLCGDVSCVDIGIPQSVLPEIGPLTFLNEPPLWREAWQVPVRTGHKYDRGHAVVFSGPMSSTGAARLAAGASLRAGAGLVTLASPPSAMMVNASHLTAVMLSAVRGIGGISDLLADKRLNSLLIGPGYGVGDDTSEAVSTLLNSESAVILDADALTSHQNAPEALFAQIKGREAAVVLTPHDGEFARLFPDLVAMDKLTRARCAAERSGAVVLLKGADTVIASPDGRAAINANAPPWLATAGSGDVLAGVICGLLAQKLPAFEAATMAAWLHGAAGEQAGAGLIAEDLAPAMRPVIARLVEKP
ncbi:NAD(P)H-hydrate dehydratase [Labrenzia sp. CE80]|uniref:NAD(P)H-hydrate dehydratase n=1 Tax=Labrenzia sp. CE80 TaxID=1788986 RepID=UPI00256FDAE5|nr:NAD(P)H-hydrate dehydratase [Labrenzia sp. CE80]